MKQLQKSDTALVFQIGTSRNDLLFGLVGLIAGPALFLTSPSPSNSIKHLIYQVVGASICGGAILCLASLKKVKLTIDKQSATIIQEVSSAWRLYNKTNSLPMSSVSAIEIVFTSGLKLYSNLAITFKSSAGAMTLETDGLSFYDNNKFMPNIDPRQSKEAEYVKEIASFIGTPLQTEPTSSQKHSLLRGAASVLFYFAVGLGIAFIIF